MDETVMKMNRLNDVTFVIAVRIDSSGRSRNLDVLIDFIVHHFDSTVLVMEADIHRRYFLKVDPHRIQYFFEEDRRPVFQQTLYLNLLYRKVKTPIIAGWDADTLCTPRQIVEVVEQIRCGKAVMGIPHNGCLYPTTTELVRYYRDGQNPDALIWHAVGFQPVYGDLSVGGAFLADTKKYLQAGGENEFFQGGNRKTGNA